jgi:class 3 adenylate cyclase
VPAASGALPTGSVTFLLTDVEGSTRRWEQSPDAMRQAMAAHDRLLAAGVAAHRGHQVESGREGDSVLIAFRRPEAALACAIELQRRLQSEPWPPAAEIRVRMALNSGQAELRGGHYYGQAVYRCARLLATGHGGQVLVAQATCDQLPDRLPAGVALRDLGVHRLKDLDRPEHVRQVDHPDLAAEFPPLRSLDAFRHNLPAAASSFVDRPAEVAEIIEALGRSRLVTLTGPAGAGKTRLALHVAAQLVERYDDGAWLVELATLTDPVLVLPSLLAALGVREERERAPAEVLAAFLRDQRMLIVLDNCEHLAAAAGALASAVLAAGPGARILATSRLSLRAAGEARWPVPAMAPAEEAAALFAERALAAEPKFSPAAHRVEVLEICRRLDGNPLAIELAAARVGLMSPAEILARLHDRFRLLTTGPRSAAARHQTLRAAIDWSHDLLDARERTLFRRLSVFAGGFTLEAGETIGSGGEIDPAEVLDLLGRLVDHSPSPQGPHPPATGCWRRCASTPAKSSRPPRTRSAPAAGTRRITWRWPRSRRPCSRSPPGGSG